jgi:hypothetical protein
MHTLQVFIVARSMKKCILHGEITQLQFMQLTAHFLTLSNQYFSFNVLNERVVACGVENKNCIFGFLAKKKFNEHFT